MLTPASLPQSAEAVGSDSGSERESLSAAAPFQYLTKLSSSQDSDQLQLL